MTTLTLQIPDEQAQHLSETARQMNLTLEELAFQRLMQPADVDADFLELARSIIEEDHELLVCLA